MMLDQLKAEATELLEALATIDNSIQKAREDVDSESKHAELATSFIKRYTINVKLYDETVAEFGNPDDEWRKMATKQLETAIWNNFKCNNSLQQGILFLKCGYLNEALESFSQANGALELCSHVGVYQKNWSYVLGIALRLSMNTENVLNCALAHWYTKDYLKCLENLLHLPLTPKVSGIWVSFPQARGMFLISAIVGFKNHDLQRFANTNPLCTAMELSECLELYHSIDLKEFWHLVKKLDLPPKTPETAHAALSNRVNQEWLYSFNKISLISVLEQFQYSKESEYTEFDLLDDLEVWNAPYTLDMLEKTVKLSDIKKKSTIQMAEELAYNYTQELALQSWAKNL